MCLIMLPHSNLLKFHTILNLCIIVVPIFGGGSFIPLQTHVSVEGVLFEVLAYIVNIRNMFFCLSLLCTLKRAFALFEVEKLYVHVGALRFRERFDNKCVTFVQSIVVIWS